MIFFSFIKQIFYRIKNAILGEDHISQPHFPPLFHRHVIYRIDFASRFYYAGASFMKLWSRIIVTFLPSAIAYAHCDAPCGIYDPKSAQIAAATVLKMVEKIEALPQDENDWSLTDRANFSRYVLTKEEHGRKCKEDLLVLWTDYFKPEHLTQFPELHTTFWQAAKLCSKAKQEVSRESAEALVKAVDEIATIFAQTKAHTH